MRFTRLIDTILAFPLIASLASPALAQPTLDDVCAGIELLNRSVDRVLDARSPGQRPKEPVSRERGLRLEHVYQLHLACLEQLHELEAATRLGRIPPLASSRPLSCRPGDVTALSQLMHEELKRPAWILWVTKLPEEKAAFTGRTADDAFGEALRLYVRMNSLADKRQVMADETYAQLVRAVADAKAVLQHIDPAHRYRIDAPAEAGDKSAADVYAECLLVRRTLSEIMRNFEQPETPLPDTALDDHAGGEDVFVQTQIVLAELNLLKLRIGVTSNTPLAVKADKTWSDACNQAALLNYLLRQVTALRQTVESTSAFDPRNNITP
jgi:hypothetical protein